MMIESVIQLINVNQIIPNRFQPRLQFDDESLNELAESIREYGIVQPLLLRRAGDKYEIIAGERRYKAAVKLGMSAVPAIIADLDDNQSAEVAIIENTKRREMSAIEEAKAYKKLLDRNYVTQEQLAKRLGTSQANIANKIRLLTLDNNVQDALLKGKISERHARSLLRVTDKMKQVDLLNKIILYSMPVRTLDEEIDKILKSYGKSSETTGGINTNKSDIDLNDIKNKSIDINNGNFEYVYTNERKKDDSKKKNSLLFNNLENESVNMNPNENYGFNPFEITDEDDDFDILNLEDDEEFDKDYNKESTHKVEVQEIKVETPEDVINETKNIITKGVGNGVSVKLEEFNFDDTYQIIIRVSKKKDSQVM